MGLGIVVGVGGWQAFGGRGGEKDGVGTNERRGGLSWCCKVVIASGKRTGKLHSIVGAQRMATAKCSGTREDGASNTHDDILLVYVIVEIG